METSRDDASPVEATQPTDPLRVIAEFDAALSDPGRDPEGRRRQALAEQLGELGDPRAVPVLVAALGQPTTLQPIGVHRAAATALGQIGHPAAVDALLSVPFQVPDAPTTTNIGERAKRALAAIGEPAVPATLQMLQGTHEPVQTLAAAHDLPQSIVVMSAAGILGAIGSSRAVEPLLDVFPKCTGRRSKAAEVVLETANLRGVLSHALGLIGDAGAVPDLCTCVGWAREPMALEPILQALGRMGGPAATTCLVRAIREGEYRRDDVQPGFELEPRWSAARHAILAGAPLLIGKVETAMAANTDPAVKQRLAQWAPGLEVTRRCGDDDACYIETLRDAAAPWFARETAAFVLARKAAGDHATAEAIARAYAVRDPDGRVSMAWLPRLILGDRPCPACADALQAVLDDERHSMAAEYQAAVLTARTSIARFRRTGATPQRSP